MNSVNTYTAPNLFFCAVCHEFHVIGEDCPPVFVSTPIHKDQDDGQKKKHKFVLTYQDEELKIKLDDKVITSVFRDDLGHEGLVLAADIVRTIAKKLDIEIIEVITE